MTRGIQVPSFDEMTNKHGYFGRFHSYHSERYEPYQIDFSTPEERRYREDSGVVVYENGAVEIHGSPYGSPRRRDYLRSQYNIEFRLKKDTAGLEFFLPTGEKVHKKDIEAGILFLDHNHHMALSGGSYRDRNEPIRYYGPYSRPLTQRVLRCKQYHKKAALELKAKLREVLDLALTFAALNEDKPLGGFYFVSTINFLRSVMEQDEPVGLNPVCVPHTDILLDLGRAQHSGQLMQRLLDATATEHKVNYLNFRGRE